MHKLLKNAQMFVDVRNFDTPGATEAIQATVKTVLLSLAIHKPQNRFLVTNDDVRVTVLPPGMGNLEWFVEVTYVVRGDSKIGLAAQLAHWADVITVLEAYIDPTKKDT